jgi:methionyl-tRNA formyltransferase
LTFNWKLPAQVLAVPPLGAINLHDALLPRNRGLNATGWSLRRGDPEVGITAHYMTAELDDGPILAQRAVPIADADDIDTILPRMLSVAPAVLGEALTRVAAGDPGVPQREEDASYAGRFEEAWKYLD